MKTFEKAILCGLIFSVLLSITAFSGRCESISQKVFRLHILANSDLVEDQELKLKVRDKILESSKDEFLEIDSMEDAKAVTAQNIDKMIQVARQEIKRNGYDYDVKGEIVSMYFNTRRYGNIVLPAGYYNALRIVIGKGEGKNWWCVMFPPICVSAAEEPKKLDDVLSSQELDITENEDEYEFRFKIVEIFEKVCEFFDTLM